jgi:hypothetical protein
MKLPKLFKFSSFIFGNILGLVFLLSHVQPAMAFELDFDRLFLHTIPFPTRVPFPTYSPLPTLKPIPTLPPIPTIGDTYHIRLTPSVSPSVSPTPTATLTPTPTEETTGESPTPTQTLTPTPMEAETPTPTPTTGTANVVLNEIMPDPTEGEDWVEIYNPTADDLDISNMILRDGASTVMATVPDGTILSSGDYLVVEVGTRLNQTGDHVFLKDQTDTEVLDDKAFAQGDVSEDVSIGRETDGGNLWKNCINSSKGTSNDDQC